MKLMTKKVALLIPHHFSLYEVIVKNLEANNYDVELLLLTDKDFKYKNVFERTSNLIQKVFFKNKNYKSQLRIKRHSELLELSLKESKTDFDYALVIRPDYFTKESLELLKKKSKIFTAYQWDGFKRYPDIINYIDLFDRFFVFDKIDYFQYRDEFANLFPITNFFVDIFTNKIEKIKNEVFFLGSYLENRINEIISITEFFQNNHINTNIQVVYTKTRVPEKLLSSSVKILSSAMKYEDMIQQITNAKILLEFQNTNIHNGLSFRVFEALYFQRKLITNNCEVKNYDFYNPNNILIWEDQNYDEIVSFLNKDMVKIEERIIAKYSFSNWIRYVFDNQPYQIINF